MSLYDFCHKWKKVAIYGAGIRGRGIYGLLLRRKVNTICYVVTKKNDVNILADLPIYALDDFLNKGCQKDTGIIVAVSDLYKNEIISLLQKKGIENYCCCESVILEEKKYEREAHPVNPEKFLLTSDPCDDHFGTKRGTPIDRYYIENFIYEKSREMGVVERVLEVGEDIYCKSYFPTVSTMDIVDYKNGWDLTDTSTLPQNYYDVFICTQTLNFIYDIKAAIRGSYSLLKNGGVLLATVAGNISQVCVNDNYTHYWNFTAKCIKNLMAEVFGEDNVQVFPFGNVLAATGFIQGVALEELPQVELLDEKNDGVYSIVMGIVAKKI